MTQRTMKTVFGFEIDQDLEMEQLRRQLDAAGTIILERLVHTNVACQLYDAHVTSDDEHSCLGCNLNEAIHQLGHFLEADIAPASQLTRLQLSLGLVNMVWERISDVCETLEVPKQLWCANEARFRSFKAARRWANFMKHPGFFGLGIHHPIYVADGFAGAQAAVLAHGKRVRSGPNEWVLIESDFVKEHWSDDQSGQRLRAHLREPFTACVVLPNVGEMAPGVCDEFIDFVERMKEGTWVDLAREHVLAEMPCDWWE